MNELLSIKQISDSVGFIVNGSRRYLCNFKVLLVGDSLVIESSDAERESFSGYLGSIVINDHVYTGDPDGAIRALEFLGNFKKGSGGIGGSGALVIQDDLFFASAAARDSFFESNPDRLSEGIYVSVNGSLEQRRNGMWVDVSVLVRGPAGLSAYEIAIVNGFEGTEQEWLDSLSAFDLTLIDGGKM